MPDSLTVADKFRSDTSLRIDGARLLNRIDRLAEIGGSEDGGVTRMGFSDADQEGRAYVARQAVEAGLSALVDAGGNLLIRRPDDHQHSTRPPILVGSHLDTVANGGRLDGAYGVIAALEVLQTLHEAGAETDHETIAVGFANEEGALFPQPFWGSMVLAGRLDALPSEPEDYAGKPLRDALARAGGDLSQLRTATWAPGSLTAYLELHVEQGPVLERLGRSIGVVESITGRTHMSVQLQGKAGHAGTTPMEGRQDPLVVAASLIQAVQSLATKEKLCRVATVGRLEVQPNSPNTIPDAVRLDIDLRDSEPARLDAAEHTVRGTLAALARLGGVRATIESTVRSAPVHTDPRIRDAIAASATELGHSQDSLPSGAGHDAQVVADLAPVGMIFVPSIDGVSHVPSERTAPKDLIAGAEVLLRTVLKL
ncbi:Zn-dependent hydrolase [Streptomyces sp. NBC_00846]|uniref:Zn-dependent hydrolase n=1 Tax=Streptomyces sp. NBC_00846 TaxID=2975849 RepID=UPI00386F42F7|nr:Zn-dependent hydrolase [Streptomyces sp. NBC_00846]